MFNFLKRSKSKNAAAQPAAPVSSVNPNTRIVTMPQKFLIPDAVPFWNAKKVWAMIIAFFVILVGVVIALVVTQPKAAPTNTTPEPTAPAVIPPATSLPSTTVPPETEPTPAPEPTPPPEPITPPEPVILPSSLDSDNDGLTNVEESVYGTDPQNPDTDGDSYSDGDEVRNNYSPRGPEKIGESGLWSPHTSGEQDYLVLFPAPWSVRPTSATGDELELVASADEFVTILVQPNPNALTIGEWYASINPDASSQTIESATIGAHNGIFSANKMNFYFILPERPDQVFVVSQHVSNRSERDFAITFLGIIRSIASTTASQ